MTDKLTYADAIKVVEHVKGYYDKEFVFISGNYSSEECKKIDKLLKDNGLTGISRFTGFTARWLCDLIVSEFVSKQEDEDD